MRDSIRNIEDFIKRLHLPSAAVGVEDVEGEVVEAARDAHPARHRRVLLHRHRPAQHPAKIYHTRENTSNLNLFGTLS